MLTIGTDPGILADINPGRVPVISWNCGDDAGVNMIPVPLNLVQIAYGQADNELATIKAQLATLVYPGTRNPYPVMLRYFCEFNINAGQTSPYANGTLGVNNNAGCFVTPGDVTFAPQEPKAPGLTKQFIDAWVYIHNYLNSPAQQLTYVWNPSVVDASPEYGSGKVVDPLAYYPGSNYVDWIGVDGYQRLDATGQQPVTFSALFSPWYSTYSTYNKPMMIGETAGCQIYSSPPYNADQVSWIQTLETSLKQRVPPPGNSWGQVRALMYFDAPGGYSIKGQACDWRLNPAQKPGDSISGLTAFANLANDSFFSPKISAP